MATPAAGSGSGKCTEPQTSRPWTCIGMSRTSYILYIFCLIGCNPKSDKLKSQFDVVRHKHLWVDLTKDADLTNFNYGVL